NVGEGFSVGTSRGWSAGFDFGDLITTVGTAGMRTVVSRILKPFSFKYGTGLSESQGTSVSESTYLVSQIAGFDVELTDYERCAAIRFSDDAIANIASRWGDSRFTRAIGLGTANFSDERV